MSGQTKKHSWMEVWSNIVIGFALNYLANLIVLPIFFGHSISYGAYFIMGLVYTVIAAVRGYFLRRAYNWMDVNDNWTKVQQWQVSLVDATLGRFGRAR